jgi:hypothetical protein
MHLGSFALQGFALAGAGLKLELKHDPRVIE